MINFRKLFKRKTKVINIKFRIKHDLIRICDDPDYMIIKNKKGREIKVFTRAYRIQGFFGKTRAVSKGQYQKEVKSFF
jgi:hypothetical protein